MRTVHVVTWEHMHVDRDDMLVHTRPPAATQTFVLSKATLQMRSQMFRARHVRKARTMDRVSFRGCPRYSPAFSRPSNQVTREPTGRNADLYKQQRGVAGGGGLWVAAWPKRAQCWQKPYFQHASKAVQVPFGETHARNGLPC